MALNQTVRRLLITLHQSSLAMNVGAGKSLCIAAVCLSAISVSAVPFLQGNLGFTGTFDSLERFDGSSSTWVAANNLTAERIHFSDADAVSPGVQLLISGSTGDFASQNGLLASIASPFTFIPSTVYTPLWTTADGRFRFDLLQITESIRSAGLLYVTGTGNVTDTTGEHAVTAGIWQYSSQSGFTFSADTTSVNVPETGSTLALLGTSLLVFGGLTFLRRATPN